MLIIPSTGVLDWRLDSWVHVKRSEYCSGMFSSFSRFRIYEWYFSFFLLSFCVQLSIYDWDLVQKKGEVVFNIVSSNRFCWFCFLHFLLAIAYRTVATASFLAWSQTPRFLASKPKLCFAFSCFDGLEVGIWTLLLKKSSFSFYSIFAIFQPQNRDWDCFGDTF